MKTLLLVTLLMVLSAAAATAQTTPSELARSVARAYQARTMRRLDAGRPSHRISVTIEHSISEDRPVRRTFGSFAELERWLTRREHERLPARESRPLQLCGRGACRYDFDGGILHNHLYLKSLTYASAGGKYFVKSLRLLDGD